MRDEVTICGRSYVLGAAYRSGRLVRSWGRERPDAPRVLVAYDPKFPWPGGRVESRRLDGWPPREVRMSMSGRAWEAFAKETVLAPEDVRG